MEFGFTFNAEEVPPSERTEFTPIPAGTRVMLHNTEAEIVPTRSGIGLKFTATILSGEYENRPVWGFINVQNANPQCENIGQRELADMCLAMGRAKVAATEDLLFAPYEATLGVKADPTYGPKNVIKKYHAQGSTSSSTEQHRQGTSVPTTKAQAAAPAAKPAATKKPWQTAA